jgi:hypothetical protein
MNITAKPKPMIEQFANITESSELGYAIADFVDRFRSTPTTELLSAEPICLEPILKDAGLADAYLASTAAWLAHHYGVRVPDWAKGNARVLAKPWFASDHPKQKALFIQESPVEFRVRNIFVSANALHRA